VEKTEGNMSNVHWIWDRMSRHDDIGASSRHLWSAASNRTEPAGGNAAGALFEAE